MYNFEDDSLNKTNPLDTTVESDVEFTRTEYPYYVPKIVEKYPNLFDVKHMSTFLNKDHYHYKHCPYEAEYIRNSQPPTFNLKCKYKKSQLEWPGRCVQTYDNIIGLIRDEPNSTVRIYKTCLLYTSPSPRDRG